MILMMIIIIIIIMIMITISKFGIYYVFNYTVVKFKGGFVQSRNL